MEFIDINKTPWERELVTDPSYPHFIYQHHNFSSLFRMQNDDVHRHLNSMSIGEFVLRDNIPSFAKWIFILLFFSSYSFNSSRLCLQAVFVTLHDSSIFFVHFFFFVCFRSIWNKVSNVKESLIVYGIYPQNKNKCANYFHTRTHTLTDIWNKHVFFPVHHNHHP